MSTTASFPSIKSADLPLCVRRALAELDGQSPDYATDLLQYEARIRAEVAGEWAAKRCWEDAAGMYELAVGYLTAIQRIETGYGSRPAT